MKYQKWSLRSEGGAPPRALLAAGVSPLCAVVLSARGLAAPERAAAFLDSGAGRFHDPFLLRDMDRAVERIRLALERGERIAVYGDYDVDGITATALMTDCLERMGGAVQSYIPDRMEEGYGLNRSAVERLAGEGVGLIVTVDCGITAAAEVEFARTLGVDVVITDHHQCKEAIPNAAAVVDPRRPDCPYPFKELAGVGVALKLASALSPAEERPALLGRYADLAAMGTVADVMSLTDENRFLVRTGLAALEHTARPGLAALLREAGAEGRSVTAATVSYGLAPRINAAGRMERSGVALELLLTRDADRGAVLADELCQLNRHRQSIELDIYEQCAAALERDPALATPCIVLAGEGWHQGVVGIVASRLSERYACPAFMICLDRGKGKGSCRSFGGFNLFAALEGCADLLEGYGGHELAAGFTILEKNVEAFRHRMNSLVLERTGGAPMVVELTADAELCDPALLSRWAVEELDALEPFGTGNPRPVLIIRGAAVSACAEVGAGRHLKLTVVWEGKELDAIFFSANIHSAGVTAGDRVDVAFSPQINEYRGNRRVQLQVCDLRPALTRAQRERTQFERLCAGAPLSRREAAQLLPEREDFAAVWRFLHRSARPVPLEDSVSHAMKQLSRALPPQKPWVRTEVILEVMEERGLIRVSRSSARMSVSMVEHTGKVDLEASPLMLRLRAILDGEDG